MSAPEDHSDDAALAGEYVLRLLDDEAHAAFEARLTREPALRALVQEWEEAFATLADDIPEETPPARIRAAVTDTLIPPEAPRRKSALWAWLSGGIVAAAVAVGAFVLVQDDLFPPEPTLAATVAAEDGTLIVSARFIAESNALTLVRETGAPRPGRVLELWLIADGADAPVSLGVLPDSTEARVSLPEAVAQDLPGGVLAISDEPPGGSPTGAPTGDVLAVGPVTDA